MLVMKFGGTSVADARAMLSARHIVGSALADNHSILVVLSASSGTTDMLHALGNAAGSGNVEKAFSIFDKVKRRHLTMFDELVAGSESPGRVAVESLLKDLQTYIKALSVLGECTSQSIAEVASYGERLSTLIFHHACVTAGISTSWFDIRRVMHTDSKFGSASILMKEVQASCDACLAHSMRPGHAIVTQGFIGCSPEGATTTLGRGGSDYTAAILGAALKASEIVIWTDVSGVYSADPRIIPEARPIDRLSFAEIRELALYGAKVLHPDTIRPAINANIPVIVRNTFQPQDGGTVITAESSHDKPLQAISVLNNCIQVTTGISAIDSYDEVFQRMTRVGGTAVLSFSTLDNISSIYRITESTRQMDAEAIAAESGCSSSVVCVICLCGPKATQPATIGMVAQSLTPFGAIQLVAGTSPTSLFVVTDSTRCTQTMLLLHQVISSIDDV